MKFTLRIVELKIATYQKSCGFELINLPEGILSGFLSVSFKEIPPFKLGEEFTINLIPEETTITTK